MNGSFLHEQPAVALHVPQAALPQITIDATKVEERGGGERRWGEHVTSR
jgi:hypothetical protein